MEISQKRSDNNGIGRGVFCIEYIFILKKTTGFKSYRDTGSFLKTRTENNSVCSMNSHRRRIDLEDKTKVVAYAWGAESLPR